MAEALDRRRYAYRDDLADIALEGRVDAARYVAGEPYNVAAVIAPVHPVPSRDADLDTEALGGEAVQVFDVADGWAWCQLASDGYVGYIPVDLLAPGVLPPATHRVIAREAFAYAAPDAGSKPLRSWLFGASVSVAGTEGGFFALYGGGFIGRRHVEAIGHIEPDYVASALTLLGTPYLWGGKSARGIDCSGLVQLSLQRAGITCPRDTDMQANELPGGVDLPADGLPTLRRGDLVFWPRHVGIMVDERMIVHANGTNMSTTIDDVADIAERSRKGGPIATAIKRLMNRKGGA